MYLVSKGHIENRLCSDLKEWVDFPLGMPVVDIITEFRKDDIIPLYSLEKGTRCLLVNSTEMLAMECISDLHNMMGVYHLILVPYCGTKSVWSVWNEEIDTAVTDDEPEFPSLSCLCGVPHPLRPAHSESQQVPLSCRGILG